LNVNFYAVQGPIDLARGIFGNPVDDASLITSVANKDTAKCQAEMLKSSAKLEDTVLKEINKAKKKALKEPSVNSAAALQAALGVVLSSNKAVTKKQDSLRKKTTKKCANLIAGPDAVFPGACADPDLADVQTCAIAAARCVACLKINAFDGLTIDCDQADNQSVDGSCPLPAGPMPTATPTPSVTPTPSATPTPSP
jgi:hypothetical protein